MMRNSVALMLTLTVIATGTLAFGAPQAGNALDDVLKRLDDTATKFKGLNAEIRRVSHTELVDKNDVESGSVAAKRMRPKETSILIKMTDPETKFYWVGNGKGVEYTPKSNEAQEANFGKSKDIINQLMLLAFGSNSADLQAAYTIKLGGSDTVNGERTVRIELTPKTEEVKHYVRRCDMWINDKGLAVQQKFETGGGDYVLTTYKNMTLAPNLPDSAVKLDLPKNVKVTKIK
jgi:Outer membrane lipoprotein-sorting protein